MKRFLLSILMVLVWASVAWPAATETFYLTATGAGTKAGTSLANAFSPTEFNTAGNWDSNDAANGKIGPNDTVLLYDDHGIIRSGLTMYSSGTSGKPITIDIGPGETPRVTTSGLVTTWTSDGGNKYHKDGITTEPGVVIFDTVMGHSKVSAAAMTVDGDWFWSANTLNIYSSSAPDPRAIEVGGQYGSNLIHMNTQDYITISGLDLYGGQMTLLGSNTTAGGIFITWGSTNITIDSCSIQKCYGYGIHAFGVATFTGNLLTIRDISDTRAGVDLGTWGDGIMIRGHIVTGMSTNVTLTNGVIGGTIGRQAIGFMGCDIVLVDSWVYEEDASIGNAFLNCEPDLSSQPVTNVTYSNNILRGSDGTGNTGILVTGVPTVANFTITNNTITGAGTDNAGIKFYRVSGTNTVSNNTVTNYRSPMSIVDGRGGTHNIGPGNRFQCRGPSEDQPILLDSYTGTWPDTTVNIFYNVLDTNGASRGIVIGGDYVVTLHNNTIVGYTAYGLWAAGNEITSIEAKNNIFYSEDATMYIIYDPTGVVTSDYNLFYHWDTVNIFYGLGGVYYSTLADWQAAGHDTNSKDMIRYVDLDPLFVNATAKDFRLASGARVANEGFDLGYTTDFLGNPIVGVPDIGAFETQAATEIFYMTALGNGDNIGQSGAFVTSPTSLLNAMTPAQFNNALNWAATKTADNLIGPGDTVLIYDDDGVIRATLTPQASGLSTDSITISNGQGESPEISTTSLVGGAGYWTSDGGNVYHRDNITTRPMVVIFDDVFGGSEVALVNLNADKEWFWTGNTLSIYSTSDPDGRAIEIGGQNGTNCIDTNGKNYIIFSGLSMYGGQLTSSTAVSTSAGGIWITDGSIGIEIIGCTIQNIFGFGIQATDSDYLSISSTTIRTISDWYIGAALGTCGDAMIFRADASQNPNTNLTVSGCTIGGTMYRYGINVRGINTGSITGNIFEDTAVVKSYYINLEPLTSTDVVTGLTISNNILKGSDGSANNGITFGGDGDATRSNITVTGNTIIGISTDVSGIYFIGTGTNTISHNTISGYKYAIELISNVNQSTLANIGPGNLLTVRAGIAAGIGIRHTTGRAGATSNIFHNIINANTNEYAISNTGQWAINSYHNVLYNFATMGFNTYHTSASGNFKNNILYSTDASIILIRDGYSHLVSDYNIFYHPNDAGDIFTWGAVTDIDSLAAWRTASGQDANSIDGDPLFFDLANLNFSLAANSPCRDVGATGPLGGSVDYEGNAIDSTPDIGAYEVTKVWYVDNAVGSDTLNSGYNVNSPWATIALVNAQTFSGDDSIRFKKGLTWLETLTVPASGTDGHPITFGAYGSPTDNIPIIDAAGVRAYAIDANAKDWVTYQDLDLRNGTTANILLSGTNNIVERCKLGGGVIGVSDSGGTNTCRYDIFTRQTNDAVLVTTAGSVFYNLVIWVPNDDGVELQANAVINNTIFEGVPGTDIFENGGTNAPLMTNYLSATGKPGFVNGSAGDFTLRGYSPCINTGTDLSLTTDFVGNIVPYNEGIPDIGAYEYQATPTGGTITGGGSGSTTGGGTGTITGY